MQNNNDHMGGYVEYFTDMPATNGYPNTVVFPRDDEMTVVCQGPFGGGETTAQGDGMARRQAHPHHAELCLGALHQGLRPRAGGKRAQALRQRHHRRRRHLSDVVRPARLHQARFPERALCRRLRPGRHDQGDQERGGDGAGQARGADAGRRHARRFRRGEARHARHRGRRGRAALQPVPRQRERHLSLRLDAARQAERNSPTGTCRTASSRRATRSRCWSRTTVPAACTPSSAAPAWSARCRRR